MDKKLKQRYEDLKSLFDDENRKEAFNKLVDFAEKKT